MELGGAVESEEDDGPVELEEDEEKEEEYEDDDGPPEVPVVSGLASTQAFAREPAFGE